MYKNLLFITLFICSTASAQLNIYDFNSYKFEDEADYKAAEPMAAEVAILLLSIPVDKQVEAREQATDFLYEWMVGTPDYVFGTGRMRIILGEDHQLLGVSCAAQVKYALENNQSIRNNPEAIYAVWITIADYVGNRRNHVDLTPKLKELVKANKDGKMEEFIKRHE
jgi:hypothetical protein